MIFGNYEPTEVLSLWETEELAKANVPANTFGDYYSVEAWPVGKE